MVAAQYIPDPMNQFNRLIRIGGLKGTGSYTFGSPWDNMHYNPTTGRVEDYDSRNCTATCAAVLWDCWNRGLKKTSPNAIRNNQRDFAGGIGWDDVNEAYWNLFGLRMTVPPSADWYDVLTALRNNRPVGIQGDYDQVPWAYQAQKGGSFDHAFTLHGYRASDSKVLLGDPLAKHLVWVPQSAIRPAAEKLALVQRGTKSRLFVMYSREVAAAPPVQTEGYRVHIAPIGSTTYRPYWRYLMDANERYIIDRVAHKTKGWSARCTAPVNRTVGQAGDDAPGLDAGDVKKLVRVIDDRSSYNKWWVAAGYAEEV